MVVQVTGVAAEAVITTTPLQQGTEAIGAALVTAKALEEDVVVDKDEVVVVVSVDVDVADVEASTKRVEPLQPRRLPLQLVAIRDHTRLHHEVYETCLSHC